MTYPQNTSLKLATRLAQIGRNPGEQFGFVNTPVYRGSTVLFKTLDDIENGRAEFTYGTHGNPTIRNLENAWSDCSGAAGTRLAPSGLSAIVLALFTLTKSGAHLLMPDSVYGPTRRFCNGVLARFGVSTTYYDPMIGAGIETLIKPETTCIFLESPGSQTFEVQDVPAITAVAKKRGIKTAIDNTWATPVFFRAHELGCDLSIEAGTKYLSGHSDLLLGLVSANEETWQDLRVAYDAMANLPGPEDCFLALRGMRTLTLRLKEAERKGLEAARWLKARPEVIRVLHPALPDCPGHELWKRDFTGSTGVFSIVLDPRYTKNDLARMLDGLSLFGMGYSWGGFESLVTYFDCAKIRTAAPLNADGEGSGGWNPGGLTLRFQIGLEDMEDLLEDIDRGFERLRKR